MDQPEPPSSLPAYITDGVPKQSEEALQNLQTWTEELLEYRRRPIKKEEIEDDSGETIENIQETTKGTVVIKKVPCGKSCSGCPHGPYKYRVFRKDGKTIWDYQGKVN
jgi:hypothetical protein